MVAVAIALVPTLVAVAVEADPVPIEVVGADPTAVGVAMPVPGEFAAVEAAPIAVVGAAASTRFVVVKPVAVQQQRHALRALYDRCEYAAICKEPPALPQPR